METLYCKHLELADEARTAGIHAEKKEVKMKHIKKLIKNESDCEELAKVSSGGKIIIWKLPDQTYIVPSMAELTHESPVEFLHISNNKCPLSKCKEKKSKIHALSRKDQPLCLHTFLIHALGLCRVYRTIFCRLANAWLDSFFMSVWLGVSAKVELTVIYFEFVILSEVFLLKLPLLKPEGRAVIGQNL